MSSRDASHDEPYRLRASIRLVVQRYARQVRARPWLATVSLLLPGVGNIFVHYVPPLAIAHLLATLAHDAHASVLAAGGHYASLWQHQSGGFLQA